MDISTPSWAFIQALFTAQTNPALTYKLLQYRQYDSCKILQSVFSVQVSMTAVRSPLPIHNEWEFFNAAAIGNDCTEVAGSGEAASPFRVSLLVTSLTQVDRSILASDREFWH